MIANKNNIPNNTIIPSNWWDPRIPKSFFSEIYRKGDNSFEGNNINEFRTLLKRTTIECNMIEKIIRPHKGSLILDCPCGIGRHSIELAKRGYNLVGVDLDQNALNVGNRNLYLDRDVVGQISFINADKRNIPLKNGRFHLVINMFLSFGYFMEDSENIQVLKEFIRLLAPGGKILIHTDVNPTCLEKGTYADRKIRTLEIGGVLKIYEKYNLCLKRLEGLWEVHENNNKIKIGSYSIRIYSHIEMGNILIKAGFKFFNAFNMQGKDLIEDPSSPEVVYVAAKGDS